MSITYKELAWMINPAKLDDSEVGRVRGCPTEIGGDPFCEPLDYSYIKCAECWNREIPYPVIAEAVAGGDYGFTYLVGDKFEVASVDIDSQCIEIFHWKSCNRRFYIPRESFKFYIDKSKEEKKVEKKEFTINDLETGMVVHTRSEGNLMVFGDRMIDQDSYMKCVRYNEDLKTKSGTSEFDIMEVTGIDQEACNFEEVLEGKGPIIWERKEEKEISAEEAFRILSDHYGCEVKVRKD